MGEINGMVLNKSKLFSIGLSCLIILIFVAFYPGLLKSKQEYFLVCVALFFFLGVQKFRGDDRDLALLTTTPYRPASAWRKLRIPLFLACGLGLLAWLGVSRLLE